MLRGKQKKKPLKGSICIANSLGSFFGDVTSGGSFAFCLQVFFLFSRSELLLLSRRRRLAVRLWQVEAELGCDV